MEYLKKHVNNGNDTKTTGTNQKMSIYKYLYIHRMVSCIDACCHAPVHTCAVCNLSGFVSFSLFYSCARAHTHTHYSDFIRIARHVHTVCNVLVHSLHVSPARSQLIAVKLFSFHLAYWRSSLLFSYLKHAILLRDRELICCDRKVGKTTLPNSDISCE